MQVNNLVFFNHWQNGDIFINRNYIKHIASKLNVPVYYAHKNHDSITRDLNFRLIRLTNLPVECRNTWTRSAYDEQTKTLFINTWVGVWIGKFLNHGEHANFVTLHKVWNEQYKEIFNGENLAKDYFEFLPTIDYSTYDLSSANEWLKSRKNFVIICNGKQQSSQSNMGDMSSIIERLTSKYSDIDFLICDKLPLHRKNITYTDDIFNGPIGNLPHISYMSQFSNLIVGKNSGPFSYSHTYENNLDSNKTFLCFSTEMKHCLAGEGEYYATHMFSDTTEDDLAIQMISKQIESMHIPKSKERKTIQRMEV